MVLLLQREARVLVWAQGEEEGGEEAGEAGRDSFLRPGDHHPGSDFTLRERRSCGGQECPVGQCESPL